MITISGIRHNGEEHKLPERTVPISKALNSLVEFELGYGGNIVELTESRVVVQTRVMNCVDTTVFEGSAEDMRPLAEVAGYYLMVSSGEANEKVISSVVDALGSHGSGKGLNTLLFTNLAPLMVGAKRVKMACVLALGVEDEESARTAMGIDYKDLIAMLELHCEFPEVSFGELVELTGISQAA